MVDLASIRPSQATRPVSERDRAAEGAARAAGADETAPQDRVTISAEARTRAQGSASGKDEKDGKVSADGKQQKKDGKLTVEQQRQVAWLQQRDVHVRQHEAAHQAAGGSLTGGASFSYQIGPDGRSYAVGGEVPVRLASGRTPDETIANARQARRAALAPSDPSAADLAVANAAAQMEQAAQAGKARLATAAYGKHAKKAGEKDRTEEAGGASYQGSLQASDEEQPQGATRVAA